MVVQDRCYKGGTGPADYFVFLSKWECQLSLGNRVFVVLHKGIISAVKRTQFVSDRILYTIIISDDWCDIVLNVHAPTENKSQKGKIGRY